MCDLCQQCKDTNKQIHGATKAIITSTLGEHGPLVTCTAGVWYILVLIDNFTKYIKLYAMKCATTYAMLKRIKEYVEEHGCPKNILTDNGIQFTTYKWKDWPEWE